MKRFSYAAILRQRTIVAGLTLGLIAVMIGVGIDIYISNNTTTISGSTRALTEPLNPQLDVETVETLESYETVTVVGARAFVRQFLDQQQLQQQQEEQAVQESLQELGLPEVASNPGVLNQPPEEGSEEVISPFTPGQQTEAEPTPEPELATGAET